MSRSVNINLQLLEALVKLKQQPRTTLLNIADKSLVTAICECALNLLNGNVTISPSQKNQLFKERRFIRSLARSRVSWKTKRQLIARKAHVIPLIIDPAIKALKNESCEENGTHFA